MPAKKTPRLRGMLKDRVVVSVRHARKVLVFHRRLADRRLEGRIAPRTQEDRQHDLADVLADLRHYAARYLIDWVEVERMADRYMESDKED